MQACLAVLLLLSLLGLQLLAGGTRLVYALCACLPLALAGVLTLFRRPPGAVRPPLAPLLSTLLFAGYLLFRTSTSPVPFLSRTDHFQLLACLLAYGLVVFYLPRGRPLVWITVALLLLAVAETLVGLRQFTQPDDFMPLWLKRPPTGRRASGFLISPNHFAGLLEMLAPLVLSLACWSGWKGWVRGLLGYVAAACLVGIAVSGSRGGYFAVAFGLAIFGGLSLALIALQDVRSALRRGVFFLVAGILASVGLLSLLGENVVLGDRLMHLNRHLSGDVVDWRPYNRQAALEQSRLAPWLGTGAGTHLYLGRYFRRPLVQSNPVHVHCDYLELLAEYGWVGATLALCFLAAHLEAGGRRLRLAAAEAASRSGTPHSFEVALLAGVLSALGAILLHSLVDFNLHIFSHGVLVAALLGLLVATPASPGFSPWQGWTARLTLAGVALWFLAGALPLLPWEWRTEQMRRTLRRNDYAETIRLAEAGAGTSTNPETYFYQAEAQRASARQLTSARARQPLLEAAVLNYRRSLQLFPQDEFAWIRLGMAFDTLRRFPEAEEAYLTALSLDPRLAALYAYYAAHLQLRGQTDQAAAVRKKGESIIYAPLGEQMRQALEAPANRGLLSAPLD